MTGTEIALKIGRTDHLASRLSHEYNVYSALGACAGVAPVHWYGKEGLCEVIVLDHLGTLLGDLIDEEQVDQRKTFLYASQMLSAIELLHTRHYVHCDIKPDNFMVRAGRPHAAVFLIDFGLAWLFCNPATYLHIPYSNDHSIVGTLPHTNVMLVWTPVDEELEGQAAARLKATDACRRTPPGGVKRVQSAAFQKDRTRQKAYQEWATEWEKRQGDIRAGRRIASFADKIMLTRPPDRDNHPLWLAATECERDDKGKRTKKALFSRRTTSTAFQIAVDHAFTSSYAARFRPADPPESLQCPCGEPLRSSVHTLYHCQRFYFERHTFGVVKYGHIIPYDKLLSSHKKNTLRFLTFLQETRTLSRPETGPDAYVPPKPD
ncbi:kinase-like domain-containing protein [Lactarius pseudohatsudake]|nr:kinase-like domain-containing protein [Lactarius pseudohatsudake]